VKQAVRRHLVKIIIIIALIRLSESSFLLRGSLFLAVAVLR
jgi:hypothetical protein